MFYKKCCFRKIVNIYPDEEPCKYAITNRFASYYCYFIKVTVEHQNPMR